MEWLIHNSNKVDPFNQQPRSTMNVTFFFFYTSKVPDLSLMIQLPIVGQNIFQSHVNETDS